MGEKTVAGGKNIILWEEMFRSLEKIIEIVFWNFSNFEKSQSYFHNTKQQHHFNNTIKKSYFGKIFLKF